MAKQSNLFHTKGYKTEITEFTSTGLKQIVTGQPDDSHVIKIYATNNDTIQHTLNLLIGNENGNKDLFINIVLPPNTSSSVLDEYPLGMADSNGNDYFPLSSNFNLMVDLKTNPNTGKKLTVVCISEYF